MTCYYKYISQYFTISIKCFIIWFSNVGTPSWHILTTDQLHGMLLQPFRALQQAAEPALRFGGNGKAAGAGGRCQGGAGGRCSKNWYPMDPHVIHWLIINYLNVLLVAANSQFMFDNIIPIWWSASLFKCCFGIPWHPLAAPRGHVARHCRMRGPRVSMRGNHHCNLGGPAMLQKSPKPQRFRGAKGSI